MSDSRDDERVSRERGQTRETPPSAEVFPDIPGEISAAISAAMDDELDGAGREALDRALAGDQRLAARSREFEAVDVSLRTLAQTGGLNEERLREGFEVLRSRLAETETEATMARDAAAAPVPDETTRTTGTRREGEAGGEEAGLTPLDFRRRDRRGTGPWLLAAALYYVPLAALLLYLLSTLAPSVPGDESVALTPSRVVEAPVENDERAAEQALALGYGEELNDVTLAPGVPIDDLAIIEELEILEFLAARASEGRG